nr:MAG TPA: tail tape measure [Caudoviricetes sp.]
MAESYSIEAILSATDKNMSSTFKRALGVCNSFGSQVKSIVAGVGVTKALGAAMNTVTTSLDGAITRFDTLHSYPKVMNSLGFSTDAAKASVSKLNTSVQGLPTSLADIVKSAQSLTSVTGNMDKATDTAIALNHALLASSASTEDVTRAQQQYSQMLAVGKPDMQSWRTLQETMAPALTKTAKKLGIVSGNTTELYNAMKNGQITFDQFNAALIECDTEAGGFAETALSASKTIRTGFTNIKSAVENVEMRIISAFNNILDSQGFGSFVDILDKVKSSIYSLSGAFMETKDGIDYTFKPAILQDFMSAINTMKTKVRSALNAFKDTGAIQEAQKALNKFGQAFNKIGDALANSMLLETIANIFGQIVGTASYFAGEIASQFSSLIDINGITNTCNQVKQVFSDMAGALKGAWEKFRDTGAIQACASALSAVKDAVLHVIDACAQSGVIEDLAGAFGKVVKKVAEAIEKIAEFVSSLDPGTIQTAFKAVTGLFVAFTGYKAIQSGVSHLKSFGSAAKNAGANAKDAVSNVKNLISAIKESASTKSLDPLKNLFKKKKDDSDESGDSVPNTGGIDKIKAKYEGIAKVVESVGNTIKTSIEGIGTAISGILDSITQGISLVIETLGTAISGIVTSLGSAISTAAQGIGTGIATIFRGLGEALAMIPPTTWLGIAAAALAVGAAFALAGSQGEGLQMILNGVATVVTALGPVIQTVFEGICSTIESFGSIIATVFDGISGVITAFGEAVSGVLQSVSGVIDSIGTAALNAGKGFKELANGIKIITGLNLLDMGASLAAVAAGIGAISAASVGIGSAGTQMMALVTAVAMVGTTFASTSATVTSSLNSIISAMSAAEARASTSGTAMGAKFTSGLRGSLSRGVSVARSSCNNIISAFNACQSRAQYCGQMIGQGLANGLRASEGSVRAAAASLAAAADAAIQAKAKIGSPSKVQYKNGIWWAQGLVNGMKAMKTKVKEVASDILYMPNMLQPNLSYSGMTTSLNSDYTYSMSGEYIIEVPLEIDGREMARATAKYDQAELARSQKFNKTLRGVK